MHFEVLQKIVMTVEEFFALRISAFECYKRVSQDLEGRIPNTHVFHECGWTEYVASNALLDGSIFRTRPPCRHRPAFQVEQSMHQSTL